MTTGKTILVIYHSQGGTMEEMAKRFAAGAAREESIAVDLKPAVEATLADCWSAAPLL